MTKEKILEMSFSLIKDTIGDDVFEYADSPTMVLSTLTTIWGIVATTDEFIESLEMKEKEDGKVR